MKLRDLCIAILEIENTDVEHITFDNSSGDPIMNANIIMGCKMLKNNGYLVYIKTDASDIKYIKHALPYIHSINIDWKYKNLEDFLIKTKLMPAEYFKRINNIYWIYNYCEENNIFITITVANINCNSVFEKIENADVFILENNNIEYVIDIDIDLNIKLYQSFYAGNLQYDNLRNILEKVNFNERGLNNIL